MKILVLDDNSDHCRGAAALLQEHDLTIVSKYDDAQKALLPTKDWYRMAYDARQGGEKLKYKSEFDVFFTDLLLPASSQMLRPETTHMAGEEMPLGTILALLALSKGVKRVAVITDKNHHDHPASAAFDWFGDKEVMHVGDARIICTNNSLCCLDAVTMQVVDRDFRQSPEGKKKYPDWKGLLWVKDYTKVLALMCAD